MTALTRTSSHVRGRRPARAGRRLVRAALAALFVVTGCARDGASRAASDRPPERVEKRMSAVVWDTVFRVESGLQDTLLERPTALTVDAGGVTVLDFGAKRVLRFDHSGHVLWRWGRAGSGPDELSGPRGLQRGADGRYWVFDPENLRVVALDTAGRARQRISLRAAGFGTTALPVANGVVLLEMEPDRPFVWIDTAGRVLERRAAPASYFGRLDRIHTQLLGAVDPASGRWAAALSVHDGFFLFDADGQSVARGWYVDPVTPPRIETRAFTPRAGESSTVRRVGHESAAGAIALSAERLYVLHSGDDRWRRIDAYAIATGEYLESFDLPGPVGAIAHHDGCLFTLSHVPLPAITGLCPRDSFLP
jgi:hypothetical protein